MNKKAIPIINYFSKNNTYCIYIGFAIPKETALFFYNSFAGNEAEINFIENVLSKYNLSVLSYTFNQTHGSKRPFLHSSKFDINENKTIHCTGLPILNIPLIKKIVAPVLIKRKIEELVKYIKKNDSFANIFIVTCNSYPIFSIPALSASKRFRLKTICYLIDGFYYDGKLNILRKFNEYLAKRNLKRYDRVIALSENVIDNFCLPTQNHIAITPVNPISSKQNLNNSFFNKSTFNIVFAGGIAPLNGILLYCDLSKILCDNIKLHLFGKGELSNKLEKFVADKKNMFYHGPIEHDTLMNVEKDADLLIILRPTKGFKQNSITKYGIPFKLIEYLQSGTPVLASFMEAVPSYLQPFINICEADVYKANEMINNIMNNYDVYLKKAIEAKKYMNEKCSWSYYSKVLEDFINND